MRLYDANLEALNTLDDVHAKLRNIHRDISKFHYPQSHNELKKLIGDMENIIYKMVALIAEDVKFNAESED